jgi:hypothetical protein
MDRYLYLEDPRNKHVEWLIRRVATGNKYLDLHTGKPEVLVAKDGDPTIEVQVRMRHAPDLEEWCPVGSATIRASEPLNPYLSYNYFQIKLHPEHIAHIMRWAFEGFPYGTRPEQPAMSQEQLVIRVFQREQVPSERSVERFPVISFSGYHSTGKFVSFTGHALKAVIPEWCSDGSEFMAMPIEHNAESDEALIDYFYQVHLDALEDNDYYATA